MPDPTPTSRIGRIDARRLVRDVIRLQQAGYPNFTQPSAQLHALLDSVARRLLRMCGVVAALRYGRLGAALRQEPGDLAVIAARRLLDSLDRLRLDGTTTRNIGRLWNWVARQVDWVAADAGRETQQVADWWWLVSRDDCWRRFWPDWRVCLLMFSSEHAERFETDLRREFLRRGYRSLLRYAGPSSDRPTRAVMRVIRADVREWGRQFEDVSESAFREGETRHRAAASPESLLLRQEIVLGMRDALEELESADPQRGGIYRRLIELRHLDGLSLADVRARLIEEGWSDVGSESTIARWLLRAERRLRELLDERDISSTDIRKVKLREERAPYLPALVRPADACLIDSELGALLLGLPLPESDAWAAHFATCEACRARAEAAPASCTADARRVVPPLDAERVAGWPLAARRELWDALAAAPLDAGALPPLLREPPAVDAEQRLVIRLRRLPTGAQVHLGWALQEGGELLLGSAAVDAAGEAEVRAPCTLGPGVQLGTGALRITIEPAQDAS